MTEPCVGCGQPATGTSLDEAPLCDRCGEALAGEYFAGTSALDAEEAVAHPAVSGRAWTCGCGWSGPESALAGDYYGTLEVPGGSIHSETVCPACGEWLP